MAFWIIQLCSIPIDEHTFLAAWDKLIIVLLWWQQGYVGGRVAQVDDIRRLQLPS